MVGALLLAGFKSYDAFKRPPAFRTASIFGEHMVLQQGPGGQLWGQAPAGSEITLQFQGKETHAQADEWGQWRMPLPDLQPGGPYPLTLRCQNHRIHWQDILVGEVWMAMGQSNMSWALEDTDESTNTLKRLPRESIRLLQPVDAISNHTQTEVTGQWTLANEKAAKVFSAVALHAGLKLDEALDVPIGLIDVSVPGTGLRAWLSERVLRSSIFYTKEMNQLESWAGPQHAPRETMRRFVEDIPGDWGAEVDRPAGIYQAMVHPFVGMNLRGFWWYQGEDNARDHDHYAKMVGDMVTDYRGAWASSSGAVNPLSFFYVELPGFTRGNSDWGLLRMKMAQIEQNLPDAYMVAANDLGATLDIHPKKKQALGERMAMTTLVGAYGQPGDIQGPMMEAVRQNDDGLIIQFSEPLVGIPDTSTGQIKGFYVADAKAVYHPVEEARVKGNEVHLPHPGIDRPTAVTYNIKPWPFRSLTDQQGLPARPFKLQLLQP